MVMNLFVPSIIPHSEQPSLSSAIRNSRAFRDRSYIYDATADDVSEMNFNSEEDLLAAMELDELDKILEKGESKVEDETTRLSKLKRKSRLDEKVVELGDHATLKRKGPSARESRVKRVKEKLVDIPTMVAHLSTVNRAYGPEEPSSSSESESEEEETEDVRVPVPVESHHDLLVNITDRVANFSKRKTTLMDIHYKPPPQRLSLLPDKVPGELKNRRELFKKKPQAAEDGTEPTEDTKIDEDKLVESESIFTADDETEEEFFRKYGALMTDESETDTLQRISGDTFDTESLMHESGHYSIKPDYLNTSLQGLEFSSPTRENSMPAQRRTFTPSLAPPSEHDEEYSIADDEDDEDDEGTLSMI